MAANKNPSAREQHGPTHPSNLGKWALGNDYTVSNMNLEMGASMLAPTHIMMVASVLATICTAFHQI